MNNELSLPYLSSRTLPLHLPGAQWGEWSKNEGQNFDVFGAQSYRYDFAASTE
jgi:hypothetical protein